MGGLHHMSLKKMTRIDKISQLLIAKTGVSIRELAVELGVSEITIRRDLKQLEQQGTVKLINGVAIHRAAQNPHSTLPEYNLDYEVLHFGDRKARIGKKAASLIEPNDVIALSLIHIYIIRQGKGVSPPYAPLNHTGKHAGAPLLPAGAQIAPVSYTHLDVYKRQF